MKILIAYDGTQSADIMINELQRAGLPADVEALVFSVADVWFPPPARDEVIDDTFPLQIPAGIKRARKAATEKIKEAQETASRGAERLLLLFPRWTASAEAVGGTPAEEILKRAEAWQPNLIVVGSHDHTDFGKIFLGSVSQKILAGAKTSVRLARRLIGTGSSAQRIIVGVDGSKGSNAALQAVAERDWSPGSEVRIIVANQPLKANPIARLVPPVNQFVNEINEDVLADAEKTATEAVAKLRAALGDKSITVSSSVMTGDAADLLVGQAADFGADSIFTGANRFGNRLERFVLGSVSAAVSERARCSVEVIRAAQESSAG